MGGRGDRDRLGAPLVSRRAFLGGLAAAALAAACDDGDSRSASTTSAPGLAVPELSAPPFTLGVASGDPTPDAVVLWTRLAPDPLNGGGMAPADVPVRWEVASDDAMSDVVQRGTAVARAADAHSIHVDVEGLEPGSWYWYRFDVGGEASVIGRTRTMPAAEASPEGMRFAIASCQDYESGFFSAHRHLAADDVDLVLFLGDYIYEYGAGSGVRQHRGTEVDSLESYRDRYALYKDDGDLQAAHAAFPWVVTWDDHEVENNYAADADENGSDPETFLRRRANAYKAYWEHQPLRTRPPDGSNLALQRAVGYGDLARFFVLDTRQHRDDQACVSAAGLDVGAPCPEGEAESRTILGADQEAWLFEELGDTDARWNVLAQQIVMTRWDFGGIRNFDQWDGYPAARRRLVERLQEADVANPLVVTGDVHCSLVADVRLDFDDPTSPLVATEVGGTSITSTFPAQFVDVVAGLLGANENVTYFDAQEHGYVRVDLDRERAHADFRYVSSIADPSAGIATGSSWVIEAGRPGATPA